MGLWNRMHPLLKMKAERTSLLPPQRICRIQSNDLNKETEKQYLNDQDIEPKEEESLIPVNVSVPEIKEDEEEKNIPEDSEVSLNKMANSEIPKLNLEFNHKLEEQSSSLSPVNSNEVSRFPDLCDSRFTSDSKKNPKFKCKFCNEFIEPHEAFKSLRCSHSYHQHCFVDFTKKRLEEYTLQELCPMKTCSKEVVCSKIYDFLSEDETVKYNCFIILRRLKKSGLKPMWCKKCGKIMIIK